jgi:hypothetical protein
VSDIGNNDEKGGYEMKKSALSLICLITFGCATYPQTRVTSEEGIRFETGTTRRAVMDVISDVTEDEGFTIEKIDESQGVIVCKPRGMLNGILWEKTEGKQWNIQSKAAAYNHEIQFSATVSREGIVELKALVITGGLSKSVDTDASQKLARYYERKIRQKIEQKMRQKMIKAL